jgi:hypothetical protein
MTETTVDRRPQLDDTFDYLRPGDQLVVTKLDRLGRSLRHLLNLMADLERRQIDLQQRSPQGGLFGGGGDMATFRRRRQPAVARGWKDQLRDLWGPLAGRR